MVKNSDKERNCLSELPASDNILEIVGFSVLKYSVINTVVFTRLC